MPCPSDEISDNCLLTRYYQGDEAAMEVLAARWRPRLRGYFRGNRLDEHTAEELTQEVVVRLCVSRDKEPGAGRVDPDRPLAPYVFAMARNQLIAERRRGKPAGIDEVDDHSVSVPAHADLPYPWLAEDLCQCLQGLRATEREYFLLCAKHGLGQLSHLEIAESLGKWPAQVTQISQQARKSLKRCLESKGYR